MHLDRHDLCGKLHVFAQVVTVIGWPRYQAQEQEEAKSESSEQPHIPGRQQILMRDMHHPLPRMSREVDLPMPRHILKVAFDVRLLHEAEA